MLKGVFQIKVKLSDGNLNLQDSYASRECNGSYGLGKKICSSTNTGELLPIIPFNISTHVRARPGTEPA